MRFLILLLIPAVALALDVVIQIDGEQSRVIEAESAAMAVTDARIIIDVHTDDAEPEPEPEPEPTECGARPEGVFIARAIDWASPGGQTRERLGDEIKAYRFQTTRNPAYEGQIATGFTAQNPVARRVWISLCPGGDPLPGRCESFGSESANVYWAQHSNSRFRCALNMATRYWLNVANRTRSGAVSCPAGRACDFFLIVYTNGAP